MSSLQKLGMPILFVNITAVNGSLRPSREQGKRGPAFYALLTRIVK